MCSVGRKLPAVCSPSRGPTSMMRARLGRLSLELVLSDRAPDLAKQGVDTKPRMMR